MSTRRQWMELALPLLLLAVGGTGIWMLAFAQSDLTPEAPLLLFCLPVAWWLGRPWVFTAKPSRCAGWLLGGGAIAAAGGVLDSVSLLSLAWTMLLGAFLRRWLAPECFHSRMRLLALAAAAFPWLLVDGTALGWAFRLTGATAVSLLGNALGFNVKCEGTVLSIEGAPISVEAACAGLQSLQTLLCIGLIALFRARGASARLLPSLAILLILAWLANTLRILIVAFLVLTFGHDAASGIWHDLGGLLALALMFWIATWVFDHARCLSPGPRESADLPCPS